MSDYRDYQWYRRMVELLEEIRDRLPEPKPVKKPITAVCQHCREIFPVGPGTGRRLDAIFCSNDHRVRYHSLKRTLKPRQMENGKWKMSTDNRQ